MPKIDVGAITVESSTGYPEPFRQGVSGRSRQRLGNAVGLDQFGVNLTRLAPGSQSSQRHWHEVEDEFVYVLEGELVLCEEGGEIVLHPGDAAGFKSGVANGHCLVNRSARDAVYLEIGSRSKTESVDYPDIDMIFRRDAAGNHYRHKSGEPY